MDLLLAIYYSLLPERYRAVRQTLATTTLARGGMLSAIAECALCACLLVRGYIAFLTLRATQITWLGSGNGGTQLYMLAVLTVEYLFFHPVSFALFYLTLEGAVRALSIVYADTVLPVFPLYAIALLRERQDRKRHERHLGPPVPDIVEHIEGEYVLRIATHRPKADWRVSMALSYEGEIYQLMKQEQSVPPRSAVYLFQRYPAGQVIRGLRQYE